MVLKYKGGLKGMDRLKRHREVNREQGALDSTRRLEGHREDRKAQQGPYRTAPR